MKPKAPAAAPPTSGPRTNPRSPKNRNRPTAVPDPPSVATSASMAAGPLAADPDVRPTRPIRTPSASGLPAHPTSDIMIARPISAGTNTRFRPIRAEALPAGYSTMNSVVTAMANTPPMPTVDMPSPSLPNSGTNVS